MRVGPDATDLREMSKFTEAPNVLGLPVHAISRPVTAPVMFDALELPAEIENRLTEKFRVEPSVCVYGTLAAGCARPIRVAVITSQRGAHLAAFFQAVLFPDDPAAAEDPGATPTAPLDLCVVIAEDVPDPALAVLLMPGRGLVLALGTDEPRAPLFAVMEAANRIWTERNRLIRAKDPSLEGAEEVRLLPGGSFVFAEGEGRTLFLAGETLPHDHPAGLRERVAALGDVPAVVIDAAGAQPLVAGGGGVVAPLLRSVLLPASVAEADPVILAAASEPGSLPFGVGVDATGRLSVAESAEGLFVVPPGRPASGLLSAALRRPVRPDRLVCLANTRTEAMELWALGFPSPTDPGSEAKNQPPADEKCSDAVPDRPI